MPEPMKEPLLSYDGEGQLNSENEILDAVDLYVRMSRNARRTRAQKNKDGWDFYHMRQDWSHKQKHQSRDFMPDFPMAIERIANTFSQPFAETTDWFDIESVGAGPTAFDPVTARKLLLFYLERLYKPGNYADTARNFALVMSEAAKIGAIEGQIVLKIYATLCTKFHYMLESANPLGTYESDYSQLDTTVQRIEVPTLRLCIDVIPWEDFYPDPSGQGLFDIHEKTTNLAALRENPDYDQEVVDGIAGSSSTTEASGTTATFEKRRREDTDDPGDTNFQGPRIRETWGDIVDFRTGKRLLQNHLITTTTGRKFLRPPTPNPFYHGRRPFAKGSILRTPLSEVHKSIADHAVPVARVMNELDNLLSDGAIGSVWGIRQYRPHLLENPEEVGNGVPQGYTAALHSEVQPGEKFLERVDEMEIPQYALEMQRQKSAQFQIATALPETAQGAFAPRHSSATEVTAVAAASSGLFSGLAAFLERELIVPVLELAWLTLWQYVDDFLEPEVVQIVGAERALVLQQVPAAERFVRLATDVRFKVKGLREVLQSQEMFARLTAFLQSLGVNPALLMAFDSKYDLTLYMDDMMKAMRLDPTRYEKRLGAFNVDPVAAGVPQPEAGPSPAGGIEGGGGGGEMGNGGTGPGGPTAETPTSPGTSGTGNLGSAIEGQMAQTNPSGFRGGQL